MDKDHMTEKGHTGNQDSMKDRKLMKNNVITADVRWKDTTIGGVISSPGNAELFKTGDWRSMKPVWIIE